MKFFMWERLLSFAAFTAVVGADSANPAVAAKAAVAERVATSAE
jgi:hypothetical protein